MAQLKRELQAMLIQERALNKELYERTVQLLSKNNSLEIDIKALHHLIDTRDITIQGYRIKELAILLLLRTIIKTHFLSQQTKTILQQILHNADDNSHDILKTKTSTEESNGEIYKFRPSRHFDPAQKNKYPNP